jgi:hypothetical protein
MLFYELVPALIINPKLNDPSELDGNGTLLYLERLYFLHEDFKVVLTNGAPTQDFSCMSLPRNLIKVRVHLFMRAVYRVGMYTLLSLFTEGSRRDDPAGKSTFTLTEDKFKRQLEEDLLP